MKSELEVSSKAAQIEEQYTSLKDKTCRTLQKIMQIKSSLISYEFKLEKALEELDKELETIKGNFN